MFRLIKLAAYGLAAYTLYEFYQGFSQNQRLQRATGHDLDQAASEDQGRMQILSGLSGGQVELTEDNSGAVIPHHVGRGVK